MDMVAYDLYEVWPRKSPTYYNKATGEEEYLTEEWQTTDEEEDCYSTDHSYEGKHVD